MGFMDFMKDWSKEAFNPDEAYIKPPEVCAFCGGPITLFDKDSAGCKNRECPIYGLDVWEVARSGDMKQMLGTEDEPKGTWRAGGSRQKFSYRPEID